jgi:hypothetical protein
MYVTTIFYKCENILCPDKAKGEEILTSKKCELDQENNWTKNGIYILKKGCRSCKGDLNIKRFYTQKYK